MQFIALLFAFFSLKALCLEVAKSTGYRMQSLLSFLLSGFDVLKVFWGGLDIPKVQFLWAQPPFWSLT